MSLVRSRKPQPNPEVITTLLKAGADIRDRSNNGVTALNPKPEVISTLLKAGADGKAKDSKGKTAFDYAQDNWSLKDTDAYRQLQKASQQGERIDTGG